MHYWTVHSYPVALVKDSRVFYTYVTDHQMHIDTICFIIYHSSPTCFRHFCDHQQGVLQENKQYIVRFLVFYRHPFVGLLHKYKIVFNV